MRMPQRARVFGYAGRVLPQKAKRVRGYLEGKGTDANQCLEPKASLPDLHPIVRPLL